LEISVLTKYFTLPPLYHFLIPSRNMQGRIAGSQKPENSGRDVQDVLKAVREVIKTSLEIREEDAFSSDMPFINYGLDSIRATRLCRQLKQYIEISQTDLLLGMTWTKLEERVQSNHSTKSKSLNVAETCKRLIISALGINSLDAFSPDMPFVSYGLDSIRATQLSRKLKPYIQISHMDLLLGMSWADFENRITLSNSSEDQQKTSTLNRNTVEECKRLVVESLGVDTVTFDPDIPFINYGLDSIRATRLARQLQSYVKISQMDLLLGMAWRGLEAKVLNNIFPEEPAETSAQVAEKSKKWSILFTKLNEATGDGPIILALPGATGTLATISPMMNHARKGSITIWAAHFDLSACGDFPPLLQDIGDEILGGIKERYPHGALRIVSVSGSSTLAFLLAKALEAEGRQVLDISFLDHFPALFCHDAYGLVPYIASREGEPEAFKALDAIVERGTEIMLRLQEIDPTMQDISHKWEEHETIKGTEAIRGLETARMLNGASIAFIKNLYYQSRSGFETYDEALVRWLGAVNAPLLVVVADRGFNQVVETPWADMGAGKVLERKKNVQVLHVDAAHFEVVGCEIISRKLCL
jgi:aryl carrier-like protein